MPQWEDELLIPTIDLQQWAVGDSAQRAAVEAAVASSCQRVGFLLVANHGVPPEAIGELRVAFQAFFALPQPTKVPKGHHSVLRVSLWTLAPPVSHCQCSTSRTPYQQPEESTTLSPLPRHDRAPYPIPKTREPSYLES